MSHWEFATDYDHNGIVVDARHLVSSEYLQVAPGAALLMRILEDFIHLIGEAQKPFQSFLVVTNNLSKCYTMSEAERKYFTNHNVWSYSLWMFSFFILTCLLKEAPFFKMDYVINYDHTISAFIC